MHMSVAPVPMHMTPRVLYAQRSVDGALGSTLGSPEPSSRMALAVVAPRHSRPPECGRLSHEPPSDDELSPPPSPSLSPAQPPSIDVTELEACAGDMYKPDEAERADAARAGELDFVGVFDDSMLSARPPEDSDRREAYVFAQGAMYDRLRDEAIADGYDPEYDGFGAEASRPPDFNDPEDKLVYPHGVVYEDEPEYYETDAEYEAYLREREIESESARGDASEDGDNVHDDYDDCYADDGRCGLGDGHYGLYYD